MSKPRPTPSHLADRLSAVRVLVDRASANCKCGQTRPMLKDALVVLDEVRGQLPEAPTGHGPRPARTVQSYVVEQDRKGWVLAEYRSARPQPFRCPQQVFWTCVEVIQKSGSQPFKFTELQSQAEKRLGRQEPIYLFRISLRFLLWAKLIQHRQARFWTRRPDFKAAAREEWDRAKSSSAPSWT